MTRTSISHQVNTFLLVLVVLVWRPGPIGGTVAVLESRGIMVFEYIFLFRALLPLMAKCLDEMKQFIRQDLLQICLIFILDGFLIFLQFLCFFGFFSPATGQARFLFLLRYEI